MSVMPCCCFCLKVLPTASGVLKHIKNTYQCHQAWIEQIKAYSVHVVDLEDDGVTRPDISDNQLDDNLELNTYSFDPTAFLNPASEPEPPISPSSPPVAAVDRPASVDVDVDNDQNGTTRYSQEYPDLAGVVKAEADTKFERIRKEQEEEGVGVWSPFLDKDEWELAQCLARNVGQKQAENFL
jgi:hypothetical protein